MIRSGYSVILDAKPHIKLFGWHACALHSDDGLHFVFPLRRTGLKGMVMHDKITTPKLVAAASDKDYWKVEGDKAIRVHVKPRLQKFVPTENTTNPGSNNDCDPFLHRLGDERTTTAYLGDNKKAITLSDSWLHSNANAPLPEHWKGTIEFYYAPKGAAPRETKDVTMPDSVDKQEAPAATTNTSVDFWTKTGNTWTRHHVRKRNQHYVPTIEVDGPDIAHLGDKRITTNTFDDGSTTSLDDNWREHQRGTTTELWTRTTVFTERAHYPQIEVNDCVQEAQLPKGIAAPIEPTEE